MRLDLRVRHHHACRGTPSWRCADGSACLRSGRSWSCGLVLSRPRFPAVMRPTGRLVPGAEEAASWGGYQDDLVMPGSSPACAISRKQMRHRPNVRYTARGAAAALAAGVAAHRELRLAVRLLDQRLLGHAQDSLNGKPSARSSARPSSSVGRRRHHGDVHAARAVDRVEVDLVEHRLLVQAERVVAVAVELLGDRPRKSRMRGSAIVSSRSRNSHIRSPRRVTFAPIGMPSRSLNCAIDLRGLARSAASGR